MPAGYLEYVVTEGRHRHNFARRKIRNKAGNIKITQHNSGFGDEIYGLILKNGVHNRALYVAGETYGGGGTHERHLYLGYTEDSTINNSSYTNGAIVTIRADGNVGIGTSSPSGVGGLHVNGKTMSHNGSTAAPTNGSYGGSGDRFILWPGSTSNPPYSLGIDGGTLWYSVPQYAVHKWYVNRSEE